jgi:hypothetical protein
MGVHGLATYLRENLRALSTSLILSQDQAQSKPTLPLVVDGWSCVQLIDTLCNVIDNGSVALYMKSITNPGCRGHMVVNLESSATL